MRGSRASGQLHKQGSRMLSKASIRMSMAGGSRPRGTRDHGGYQEEHKANTNHACRADQTLEWHLLMSNLTAFVMCHKLSVTCRM